MTMGNKKYSARGFVIVATFAAVLSPSSPALAQRVRGIDVSAHQGNLCNGVPCLNWSTLHNTNNRDFVFIRSSRGGTTGEDHRQGAYPSNDNTFFSLSQRYDDPYFVQNITGATSVGMLAGTYHFARPDIVTNWPVAGQIPNTGTDDANHFLQMAKPWMRPGYLLPVMDLESGQPALPEPPGGTPGRTPDELAQFCLDFSNTIHAATGVRPIMYINGTYSQYLQSSSPALQSQLVSAFPFIWDARYAYQVPLDGSDPNRPTSAETEAALESAHPKDTAATFYGPWDDNGVTHPWSFWQYASTARLSGYRNSGANIDVNVAQGGMEFLKDRLVPAVWMNDSDGQWTTLTNWNSGQTPIAPVQGSGQLARAGPMTLPTARLPGVDDVARGVDGQNDTVILDRPNASITVTLSSGTHNIRKLYVREVLNINGGSLTINYLPSADSTPISAQFSAGVLLSGAANLSVHTLQVDATRAFTLAGGTLTFDEIDLMPDSTTPARIVMSGNATLNPLNNAAATIENGAGAGNSGLIDLLGGNRTFNVGNGAANVDLSINVPITNGALTKSGAGKLALNGANTYNGDTTVQAGTLSLGSAFLDNEADVYLSTGATLDLNFAGGPDTIDSLFFDGVSQAEGVWGGVGSGAQFISPFFTGTGKLEVSNFIAPPLAGDYNDDGVVDAADYVVWRRTDGTQAGYDLWRANFGMTAPGAGGQSSDGNLNGAVPEPSTVTSLLIVLSMLGSWRSMRHRAECSSN